MSAGSPYMDKGRLRAFIKKKKHSVKKAGELLSLSRNHVTIMTGLLTEHWFKRTPI